jgi:hypothetical protein
MIDICQMDESLRAEASELLWGKGLHALLAGYAQVHLTGSYILKLMTWRDLDIYLVGPNLSLLKFFELGSRIATLLDVPKMNFRNELSRRTEGLPQGLYWGVYLGNEREGAWKIDIWHVIPEQYQVLDEYCEAIARKLTDVSRLRILQIKSQCWMKPNYRRTFSSQDIYHAVLDEGIEDFSAFEAYLRQTKGHGG